MMSLTFGLFTQVSGSGPLGPLVIIVIIIIIQFSSLIANYYSKFNHL